MKKAFLIAGGFLVVLFAVLVTIPIVFKEDIQARLNAEIEKNVNAHVFFDADKFSLSLIKNFPNMTVSLEEFGVVGKDVFEGDTLTSIESFKIVLNLRSLIFGDQIRINRIELEKPRIMVLTLEDGRANYDIAVEGDEPVEEPASEEATQFSIGIDSWEINDGYLVYYDMAGKMLLEIKDLDHSGSGDFTQDIFDLSTITQIGGLSFSYEDVSYLTNKQINADVNLNMNLPESKYTFLENTVKVNDFAFGFDGFVAMPADDIQLDLTFGGKDNSFRSILSLVPGIYQENFKDIQTEGQLSFNGAVNGIYNDSTGRMPGFNLKMLVDNAMFKYPDLPQPVNNIQVDLLVDNPDGNLENTLVDLKKFHLDLGKNPVDASARLKGLSRMEIAAAIAAKIDLAELNSMMPMEGLTLKGLYQLDLKADGIYDSTTQQMPSVDATMSLQNGYVKTSEYPATLEAISFNSSIQNNAGKMEETTIRVNDFTMLLDGERFDANLLLENLVDYRWELAANGTLDLEKLAKIAELEDMTLQGLVKAQINTSGKMSDVEAERYQNLPTSGNATVQNFFFQSPDLRQGFAIDQASMTFNPENVVLQNFTGKVGSSDLDLKGSVSGYMDYAFTEKGILRGNLDFKSRKFNVNEWMTDEETTDQDSTAEEPLEVVQIPANINFTLNSSIDEVIYDNLSLTNMTGLLLVHDGILEMKDLKFNTLGGSFGMAGVYNTQNIDDPKFDFSIDINELSISQAYQNFNTVKTLAPIAEKMNGKFSTDFNIAGSLQPDMMPDYSSLTGGGLITIINAAVKDSKIISGVTSLTSLSNTDEVNLKDIVLNAEIKNGRIFFDPFQFQFGNIESTVVGSNGIDGSLDYNMKMKIPAGQIGSAINNALASITGNNSAGSDIVLNLNIAGLYSDPKVALGKAEAGSPAQQAKQQVKETVKEEVNQQKEEVKAEIEQKVEEKKEELQNVVEEKKEVLQDEAEKAKEEAKKKLKKFLKGN